MDRLPPGEQIRHYPAPNDGSLQPYRVYVPRRWRRRHPVVITLHGYGGRMMGWGEPARRAADLLGWALLSPDGRGNQHWDGIGEDDVFLALAHLAQRLPIDEERVYLYGVSMGGHGALRLALRHPHRFAAVNAVAGWVTGKQFFERWYAPPLRGSWPSPCEFLAPAIDAAAPWAWREHARHLPGRLAFGTWDTVNDPADTEWLIAWLRNEGLFGGRGWQAERVAGGEHGAGHDLLAACRFFAGHRRRWPDRIVSPTLRHADVGWVRAERLLDPHAPAELTLSWRRGQATVRTRNVAELTLQPDAGPRELRRGARVEVRPEGGWRTAVDVAPGDAVQVPLAPQPGRFAKRRGLSGPIGELFRERFQVIAPGDGPDREAAERFCAQWNAWTILRWRGEPTGEEPCDWWRPPYAWPAGAHMSESDLVRTEPPEAARVDSHLVLFGCTRDNALIRRFGESGDDLPFRPGGARLTIGDSEYPRGKFGWLALHPQPWNPDRLALLASGWRDSKLDPRKVDRSWLGKDLEMLPWHWPDVMVWDQVHGTIDTVQHPMRWLPHCWVFAAHLGPAWGWEGARVWRA